jgi:hypothetical protein
VTSESEDEDEDDNEEEQDEQKVVVTLSGFESTEAPKMKKRLEKLVVSVADKWRPGVTHVVVKTVPKSNLLRADLKPLVRSDCARVAETRSLKFMLGLLAGSWVVSSGWADACFKAKAPVSAAPFEIVAVNKDKNQTIDAPRRAREAAAAAAQAGEEEEEEEEEAAPVPASSGSRRGRSSSGGGRGGESSGGGNSTFFRAGGSGTDSAPVVFLVCEEPTKGISAGAAAATAAAGARPARSTVREKLASDLDGLVVAGGREFRRHVGSLEDGLRDAMRRASHLAAEETARKASASNSSSSTSSTRSAAAPVAPPRVVLLFDGPSYVDSGGEVSQLETDFLDSVNRARQAMQDGDSESTTRKRSKRSSSGSGGASASEVSVELLSHMWCLDSISNFKILGFDGYRAGDEAATSTAGDGIGYKKKKGPKTAVVIRQRK